jgi:hypothetical protein
MEFFRTSWYSPETRFRAVIRSPFLMAGRMKVAGPQ